jgi:ABC-type phosphate transport system substrate-binding protein
MIVPINAMQEPTNNVIQVGHVKIRGSSVLYPISLMAASQWTGGIVDLQDPETSSVGLDALTQISTATWSCDVAASSKIPDANPSGKNYWNSSFLNDFGMADLRIWPVGKQSLAIIVSSDNPYYSKIQKTCNASIISDLFCATLMNGNNPRYPTWKSLVEATGGDSTGMGNEPINLYTSSLSSGSHDFFRTYFLSQGAKMPSVLAPTGTVYVRNDSCLAPHAEFLPSQILTDIVHFDTYSLAYINLGFLESNLNLVKPLWIGTGSPVGNFVEPTAENVLNNSYKYDGISSNGYTTSPESLYQYLWYATNGIPTKGSEGAIKTDFINYVRMHPEIITESGYIAPLKCDFCGLEPDFASQDSTPMHPTLPDEKVNHNDITYFLTAYNAQYDSLNPTINPLCDFDSDHVIDAADITQFLLEYNAYWNDQIS